MLLKVERYILFLFFFFFFNDTATTEIYTLSLHDALPIYREERTTRFESISELKEALDNLDKADRKLGLSKYKIGRAHV